MDRYLRAALFTSAMAALVAVSHAQSEGQRPDMKSAFTTADFSALPAMPQGRSTILGGQIASVDPVLDQFTLRIFGERPMRILFDERTQVYRDGTRIPLRDLRSEEHASVQTTLEGPNVFAMSIHMLSDVPQGEAEGHVLNYNPETHELTLGSSLSREPIRLWLREDTPVVRQGQSAFTSASGLSRNTIFTNVALTPDGDVWWEGLTNYAAGRPHRLAGPAPGRPAAASPPRTPTPASPLRPANAP